MELGKEMVIKQNLEVIDDYIINSLIIGSNKIVYDREFNITFFKESAKRGNKLGTYGEELFESNLGLYDRGTDKVVSCYNNNIKCSVNLLPIANKILHILTEDIAPSKASDKEIKIDNSETLEYIKYLINNLRSLQFGWSTWFDLDATRRYAPLTDSLLSHFKYQIGLSLGIGFLGITEQGTLELRIRNAVNFGPVSDLKLDTTELGYLISRCFDTTPEEPIGAERCADKLLLLLDSYDKLNGGYGKLDKKQLELLENSRRYPSMDLYDSELELGFRNRGSSFDMFDQKGSAIIEGIKETLKQYTFRIKKQLYSTDKLNTIVVRIPEIMVENKTKVSDTINNENKMNLF